MYSAASIAVGAVWSYLSHTVSNGLGGTGRTDFGGLSRLDLDGLLQLDVELPHEWQTRVEVLGWYDFAYRINGRADYNGAVLDVYEWQVDSGEVGGWGIGGGLDVHGRRGRVVLAGEQANERGLSAARAPKQPHHGTTGNVDRNV